MAMALGLYLSCLIVPSLLPMPASLEGRVSVPYGMAYIATWYVMARVD